MNLETKYAREIFRLLKSAERAGLHYVVLEMHPMEFQLQPNQMSFYANHDDAIDHWEREVGFSYLPGDIDHPIYCLPIQDLSDRICEQNNLLNENTMNRNNLENLRNEMRMLKFDEKLIQEMEKEMEKGQPVFQLQTQLPAENGVVDVALNFRQSGSSDYYFLNRYDLSLTKIKSLEEGRHYFVITPNIDKKGENLVRKYESAGLAIDYFKEQKQNSELAMGKTPADKMTLASMENGKVEYVAKEFRTAYYSPVIKTSVFVDRGKGFNVVQSSNMLMGRAVFRDDLVSRAGEQYKAWNVYQFDEPKDKYGNYKIKQYTEGYGFNLEKELAKYMIKELDDPQKAANVIDELKDGNKPYIKVIDQEGNELPLRVEAVPRYTNLNFQQLNGRMEKREQFQKVAAPELGKDGNKAKSTEKKKGQSQEMNI